MLEEKNHMSNKLEPTIEDMDNTIQVLDMELQKQEKKINSLKNKLAFAEQERDQISKNYTQKCFDVDQSVELLWDMYDSLIEGEKIDKEDVRHLLYTLIQN